jgi:heptosyltransferase-1
MRILIVRLGSMGDVFHALPAVVELRNAFPEAHIGWAIERRWTPLLVAEETPLSGPTSPQRPLVDGVHVVNTLAWRKAPFSDETWSEVLNRFREIRAQHYDIAIDFQGSMKSAAVALLSGASTRIGFAQPREKPASMFYTSPVRTAACHVIDQNLSLISILRPEEFKRQQSSVAIPLRPPAAVNVFPCDPAAESNLWRRLNAVAPTARFAILNPGAGWGAKQWPASRYGEVARALHDDGVTSLVNYSPTEEPLAREVEAASGGAARAVFCTLSELIELTRRAALFIGGDTGPMHLANTLGIPVVALFGPTDPARTGPYPPRQPEGGHYPRQSEIRNHKSEIFAWGRSIVLRHPSSRTDRRHRPNPDPGLLAISAEDVISAARTLLAQSPEPKAQSREPQP